MDSHFTMGKDMHLEKRKHERLDMRKVFGIYAIVKDEKMLHMTIVDASPEGCAFKIAENHDFKKIPQELEVKLSFFDEDDLLLTFHVMNVREHVVDGMKYMIYGCAIQPGDEAYMSYLAFYNSLAPVPSDFTNGTLEELLKVG